MLFIWFPDTAARASVFSMAEEPQGNQSSLPQFLQQWQKHVVSISPSLASLKEEQQLGWRSPALDALYQNNAGDAASHAKAVDKPETTFHSSVVDIEHLCLRYRDHAKTILSRVDGGRWIADEKKGKVFVDLGCAPGGVSLFLNKDLGWRGVGVSLAEAEGGIAMTKQLLTSSSEVPYAFLPKSILDADLVGAIQHTLQAQGGGLVDFVNGGAVQDHGQRAGDETPGRVSAAALPWFTFLVPQLLAALRLVRRDGAGSVMVVYGMSQCGSLMLLIYWLVEILRIVPSYDNIHFFETMHLTKPPIYLLLTNVTPTDAAVESLERLFLVGGSTATRVADGTSVETARAFWTLTSEADTSAALSAFQACGKRLEAIWEKATAYLRLRREKAERLMQFRSKRPRSLCT